MSHEHDDADELLAVLASALPPERAPAHVKARLLQSVADAFRFEAFLAPVGRLCDLAEEGARALLRTLGDASRWIGDEGYALFHVDGGPAVAKAAVGFVRMQAGREFPLHTHVGEETVLVLQGGFVDSLGNAHRAGDVVTMPAGSAHALVASPGPDLLYLGVIQGGMIIDGNLVGPGDPAF